MFLLKKDKSNFKLEIRKKHITQYGTHNVTEIDYFLIFISVIYCTMGSVYTICCSKIYLEVVACMNHRCTSIIWIL